MHIFSFSRKICKQMLSCHYFPKLLCWSLLSIGLLTPHPVRSQFANGCIMPVELLLVWGRYQPPNTNLLGVDSASATYAPHTTARALRLNFCHLRKISDNCYLNWQLCHKHSIVIFHTTFQNIQYWSKLLNFMKMKVKTPPVTHSAGA